MPDAESLHGVFTQVQLHSFDLGLFCLIVDNAITSAATQETYFEEQRRESKGTRNSCFPSLHYQDQDVMKNFNVLANFRLQDTKPRSPLACHPC